MFVVVSHGTHQSYLPRRQTFADSLTESLGRRPEAWVFAHGRPVSELSGYTLGDFLDVGIHDGLKADGRERPAFVIAETTGLPTSLDGDPQGLFKLLRIVGSFDQGALVVVNSFAPWSDEQGSASGDDGVAFCDVVRSMGKRRLAVVTFCGRSDGSQVTGIIADTLRGLRDGQNIGRVIELMRTKSDGSGLMMSEHCGDDACNRQIIYRDPLPTRSAATS